MTTDKTDNRISLVADIGGTNTRVALSQGADLQPASIRRFANRDFTGLESIIHSYLQAQSGIKCARICVAVAGPVRDDVASMTNLDWSIDKPGLAAASGAKTTAILNDLQAQGHALGYIQDKLLQPVITGSPSAANATKLVIGIGTGFNAAAVFDNQQIRFVTPSECGHMNLPLCRDEERRLSEFIEFNHGFTAIEEVLSGPGLERIYNWLGAEADDPRQKSAADIMVGIRDKNDDRAVLAVQVFVQLLGSVVGNLALTHLPFGGIYLVGGVARAMAPYLATQGFGPAFVDKGRFAHFMGNFSVTIIEDDYAALTGCAHHLATLSANSQKGRSEIAI